MSVVYVLLDAATRTVVRGESLSHYLYRGISRDSIL